MNSAEKTATSALLDSFWQATARENTALEKIHELRKTLERVEEATSVISMRDKSYEEGQVYMANKVRAAIKQAKK